MTNIQTFIFVVVLFGIPCYAINHEVVEECHISTGFENQFLCAYMVMNNTVTNKKQCILEAFFRDAYSTIILMNFNELMKRNIRKKSNPVNCNTYIILIQDRNLLNTIFSDAGGHGRFHPFSNIMVIFALESRLDEALKYDPNTFQYITLNSLNVVWAHYGDFVNNTKHIEFHRVLSRGLIHIHSEALDPSRRSGWSEKHSLFDENRLIDSLIENRFGLMKIRTSFFRCAPFIYYIKKGNQTL